MVRFPPSRGGRECTHVYGILAAYTPSLRLRRVDGAYFSTYLESFERVWASARPLEQEGQEGSAP